MKLRMYRTRTLSSAAKALAVVLCAFVGTASANKMAYSLQEAIYLFEMKGETDEAVRIHFEQVDGF